jgi:glutaredoxin
MKKGLCTFVPLFVLVLATLVLSSGLTLEVTAQQAPVVRFYMFYGETCAHCHSVIDDFLPQVVEKYGDQVEYQLIEVWNDTDKYLTLLARGMKYGVPEGHQGAVPALFIGDHVLIGARDIPAELETIIDEYLAQGGVDYPSLDDLPEVVLPTPAPTVQILVAYDTAHADFSILSDLMVSLGTEYGSGLQIYPLDLEDDQNGDLVLRLNAALDVPNPPTGTPQVLIGRHMLVGLDEIERQLPGLIDTYLAEGGIFHAEADLYCVL